MEALSIGTIILSLHNKELFLETYRDYYTLNKEETKQLIEFLQQNLEKLSDDRN